MANDMSVGRAPAPLDPWLTPLSVVRGMNWPGVVSPDIAPVTGLLFQFERTQWWRPEDLLDHQFMQIDGLLEHARTYCPFYADSLHAAGYRIGDEVTPELFRKLPILTRRDLQTRIEDIKARELPAGHGKTSISQTSGSTGEPVSIGTTELCQLFLNAFTIRDHIWHQRDVTAKFCAIRPTINVMPDTDRGPAMHWRGIMGLLYPTGENAGLSIKASIPEQADWLVKEDPEYLVILPSALKAVTEHLRREGRTLPRLRGIQTVSESLPDGLRDLCREAYGAEITDVYSSQEFGMIATQCPEHEHYHIQSEGVLVEVLRDDGTPCAPGEVGRLVVTGLTNFFTPLIRYQINDYAVLGEPCPCGRGLPVLSRILGRERNMLVLPDGRRKWPFTGYRGYRDIAPIRQFQMVQETLDLVRLRLVADRPLTEDERTRLSTLVQQELGHPFTVEIEEVAGEIARQTTGKFEEFYSRVVG